MPVHRRRKGALEREVFSCLATAEQPLTVADVRGRLDTPLAYNTVLTTLARLHAKGLVDRERDGRAFAYSVPADPASRRTSLTARRMSRVLNTQTDHAGVLAQFVRGLPAGDQRLLAELAGRRHDTAGSQP